MRHILLTLTLLLAAPYALAESTAAPSSEVHVYKSPYCGCCGNWVEYMRKQGFTVTVEEKEDMSPIKQSLNVPDEMQSCHTSTIGGYVIEGHVPAEDIRRLLKEKPDAIGLAAPGMPQTSPGMDVAGSTEAYDVLLFKADGSTQIFAHHKP